MQTVSLSFLGKRWFMHQHAPDHPLTAQDAVTLLCESRGIHGGTHTLTSPAQFPDMQRAIERIERAIENDEHIALFGDYDCDGITAVSLLMRMFRRRGHTPYVRLPHRVQDGYGLRPHVVDELMTQGITLLITADTGITAVNEITALRESGIDTIVTDHHHMQAELPPAYAILHPALSPGHRVPHPSGAGVALQLLRAMEGDSWDGHATDWALAAIGTVADLVELRGDNRTIVSHGLRALNTAPLQGGLGTLIDSLRVGDTSLTSMDIGFRIAPRINAAGRMDDPGIALQALLEGGEALRTLEALNTERQRHTAELVEEAVSQFAHKPPALLFLADERYPHGLLGLIAGRLTEQYGKPSLVAAIDGEMCTASLRSPPSYHIAEALERISIHLDRYGGHAQAAGCSFALTALPEVQQALLSDTEEHTQPDALLPTLSVDAELAPDSITMELHEALLELEPFGQGNPEPRFLLKDVECTQLKSVGGGAHLQLRVNGLKAIGFRLGHLEHELKGKTDVVVRIGIDTWQGRRQPQLFIEDIARNEKTTP